VAGLADRDAQVEQGGAHADQHLPAGRIDDLELATPVDVHVDATVGDPEPPWLAVVQ
jgi:hypothetical protein